MTIDIPKGQRVRIRKYDGHTPRAEAGIDYSTGRRERVYGTRRKISAQEAIEGLNDSMFILMEPVQFNINSNFTELMQTNAPKIEQYLGGELLKAFGADVAAGVVTGVTEYSGFQRWQSTSLIETELSIGVISQGDAYKDVVQPMLNLMKITIPSVNKSKSTLINRARTLRLPGPSIIKVINEVFNTDLGSDNDYTASDSEFTICVGNLVFDHVVITNVTPTIMPETDTNGYPLSVFLKLKFRGTRIPNDEMIDEIFAGWED